MNKPTKEQPINRVPRALGTTMLSHNHQAQNTEITKSSLINHIITSYIQTGFTFMGSPCSIEQLSQLTSIPTHSILKGISKASSALSGLANPEQIQDTVRALQSIAINGTLQASGLMLEQAQILRASQGSEYKAFISSTYNIALKNNLDASRQVMDMAKQLSGPQGPGTVVNIQNNSSASTENSLTPGQAVLLMEKTMGRINPAQDTETNEALFLEHNIGDMPEVDARKQTNKGGNEALDMHKIADSTIGDHITHEDRREAEYEIDPNSDQV